MSEIDWQDYFTQQAAICRSNGSPLYADLLPFLARDHAAGGVTARLFADWHENPFLSGVGLRLLGGVHRLVLEGQLPDLARHYPSAGGTPVFPEAAEAFLEAVAGNFEPLRARLDEPVQTNEVRRSAALLGGFLEAAAQTGLPLRQLEIGASAGLNQVWDHHHYRLGAHRWGDPRAALCLESEWSGPPPRLDVQPHVASRQGCDLSPIDLHQTGDRHRLESFVWPDQTERLERLRLAARALLAEDVRLEREGAADWVARQLRAPAEGETRILFHSVMWWYVDPAEQQRLTDTVMAAGEQASARQPLAWLRMESVSAERCEIRLHVWPGGEDRLLGTCGHHGQKIEWLAPA
jgi:hypothetical protein